MISENFLCVGGAHTLALGDMLITPLFRSKNGDPSRLFLQRVSGDFVIAFEEVSLERNDRIIWINDGRELAVGDRPLFGFWSKDEGIVVGNRLQMIGHLSAYLEALSGRPMLRHRLSQFVEQHASMALRELEGASLGGVAHPLWRPISEAVGNVILDTTRRDVVAEPVEDDLNPSPVALDSGPDATLPLDKILLGDCVSLMRTLPDKSIDMVFADPPFNLNLSGEMFRPDGTIVDAVTDDWDKFGSLSSYDSFTRAWLTEARRVLKDNGTIWISGSYHNIFRVGAAVQDLGYWILNDIVWRKANPIPNFRGTRFTNSHETLIWASKGEKATYTFNYRNMKTLNDELQMRSDWEFPIVSGTERLKKDGVKLHPSQKPEALLYRIMLACTQPGDVILDPFFGTGTSGSVAKRLGRRWIGLEREPDYATAALKRIESATPLDEQALASMQSPRSQPKVAFGALVENGYIVPGAIISDARRRYFAKVEVDGSVSLDGERGSIHKIGALAQGAPACNGWTFWHVETNGRWQPLDALRQTYLLATAP